jgi:hypothetical protein
LARRLVLVLILGASRLDLRIASRVFAACLLASAWCCSTRWPTAVA